MRTASLSEALNPRRPLNCHLSKMRTESVVFYGKNSDKLTGVGYWGMIGIERLEVVTDSRGR